MSSSTHLPRFLRRRSPHDPSAAHEIILNYLVLGDHPHEMVTVQIPETADVRDLKELIVQQNADISRNVDAVNLHLYKLDDESRFSDDSLNDTLPTLTLSQLGKPLMGHRALSAVFVPPPAKDRLHIIVDIGLLNIHWWERGGEVDMDFSVRIRTKESVDQLKLRIKEADVRFDGVPPIFMKLYEISTDKDRLQESVSGVHESKRLNGISRLSECFMDVPLTKEPWIIVDVVEYKRKRDEEGETDLTPPAVKLLKREVSKGSPSSLAEPSKFCKIVGLGHAINCNRPFEHDAIPLTLLHEAFGLFKDRCEAAPSEQALDCLSQLANVACERYATESIRRPAIQSVLREYIGLGLYEQQVPGTKYTTDGNLLVNVMPAVIRECKSEAGYVPLQAILYYGNFVKTALESEGPLRYHNCNTRFPSILMVDMGSLLGFYGAAWDGERVRVEPLTPMFDLSTHWKESKARHAIASSLDALMVAVRNIQAHYDAVTAEAKACPVPSKEYNPRLQKARGYPFLTSYDDNGLEMTFTYDARLDKEKLIFSATLNDPYSDECIVKFTRRYSEAAHNCLGTHGSAPRLRQCVRISAEWTAVIMDRSKYQVLHGQKLREADQEKVRRKVKSDVQILHNEGFVHGDIRDTNLLIDIGSLGPDHVAVHFIDFDWAGRIGEARYPFRINTVTVKRPEGVKSGELITKQHDEDMISYLFR